MVPVGQYHRPHYYIIEKIFLHPNFRRRVASPRIGGERTAVPRSLVLHVGVRARAREKGTREDDPRPCDRRGKTLFSQAAINTLPNVRTRAGPEHTATILAVPADPFVKLALPHTFCRAPDYYNTLRITRSSASAEPTVGTSNFRGSFRDRRLISGRKDKSFKGEN